jgi:hypothetical protein
MKRIVRFSPCQIESGSLYCNDVVWLDDFEIKSGLISTINIFLDKYVK